MPKIEKEITITNASGLHARPAGQFVQVATKFQSEIHIRKEDNRVDGKSIMNVLTLEAHHGAVIILEVEGPDAEEASAALEIILKGTKENE